MRNNKRMGCQKNKKNKRMHRERERFGLHEVKENVCNMTHEGISVFC